MIHYNNHNNAHCWAVNAQTFETIGHNIVQISTLLCTKKLYTYSYFEIFICMYNVTGEIDQISTNASRYNTCCAANVYIFVYIFIGAPLVPLTHSYHDSTLEKLEEFLVNPHYSQSLSHLHMMWHDWCQRGKDGRLSDIMKCTVMIWRSWVQTSDRSNIVCMVLL